MPTIRWPNVIVGGHSRLLSGMRTWPLTWKRFLLGRTPSRRKRITGAQRPVPGPRPISRFEG